MSRKVILAVLLTLAAIFYIMGFNTGAAAFLVIGGVMELGFWATLFSDDGDNLPSREERT